jgi:hypothetical protein
MFSGRRCRSHASVGGWALGASLPGREQGLDGKLDGQEARRSTQVCVHYSQVLASFFVMTNAANQAPPSIVFNQSIFVTLSSGHATPNCLSHLSALLEYGIYMFHFA